MESFYKNCFDTMPCYLSVQNRDFVVIDANQRFREDFGDYEGRRCYEIYKHRDEICEVCPVARTFEDGLSHQSEEQVKSLSGKETDVIVYTTPLRDADGQINAVMEMSTDITEIKHIQKRLRNSEARYHLLFEEVPCYISIQDEDLNIIEANRLFREDFGDCKGRKCFEVYKHRTKECVPCAVKKTFHDGQSHESEEVVTSIKGDNINVLVNTAPLRRSKDKILSVMEISTNITQIRTLQEQLTSVGLLVSSISHSIRGELSGLDAGKYLVKTGMKKNDMERIEKGWDILQRNFERIRSMVLNILYYAKDRKLKYEPHSAESIAEEALGTVTSKNHTHDIEIQKDFDDEIGEFDADRQAIRSLLINLLDNSIDACRVDKKKDSHRVVFSLRGSPESIEFQIEDNGIGMERETREKAFSLFFSSKGVEGTGLGLFIANKITNAHGGTIQLDSEIDKGTRFTVRIPRKRKIENSGTPEKDEAAK